MSAMKRTKQEGTMGMRVSAYFRSQVEAASRKARVPSVSEFLKQAVIEKAEKLGVKIDRLR